jgi:hypothetical protein
VAGRARYGVRMLWKAALLLATSLGVLALDPRPACACTVFCELTPGLVLPLDGGSIPANAVALPFFEHLDSLETASLVHVSDGALVRVVRERVDAQMMVRVLDPLELGLHRIELVTSCGGGGERRQEFEVTESAPIPTTIGELRAGPATAMGLLVHNGPSCHGQTISIGAEIEVVLDPSARPWEDVWIWTTLVDGVRYAPTHSVEAGADPITGAYAGGSWRGRRRDLVHTVCRAFPESTQPGVSEGFHRVRMQARLAGTDVVLETNEVEIELECDDHDLDDVRSTLNDSGCAAGGSSELASVGLVSVILLLRSRSPRRVRRGRAMVRAR